MDFITNTFNNREIALIIYLIIFLIWTLFQQKIRKSLCVLFKTLTNKWILISYVLLILYGFTYINLWDFSLFKDSIYWTFGVGFIIMMNSDKAIKNDYYFKNMLINNLKLILILEFLVNLYVFNLIAELILMPIVIFMTMIQSYSEVYNEYSKVKKLMNNIFTFLGIGYFIFAIYKIVIDFKEFASTDNLRAFLFPIVMTIIFIPFAYLYALLMHYQSFFVRLKFTIKNDKQLIKYAKRKTFRMCNFSLSKLKKLSREMIFFNVKNKSDLQLEINKIMNTK